MLGLAHERAEELSAQAMLAARGGDRATAAKLYAEAGALEREAFHHVPSEKVRTRGILAVSFISMLYKAGEYEAAESALYALLADPSLAEAARVQLRELLGMEVEP